MVAESGPLYLVPVMLGERLKGHDNALNLFRLAFAVTVIASHCASVAGHPEVLWGGISLGTWALAGFFAISGYLIPQSAARNSIFSFLARRARRIYPAFWTMLLAVAFVASPVAALERDVDYLPGRAFGFVLHNATTLILQGDIGPETANLPSGLSYWNAPAWSIAVEVVLYLVTAAMLVPAWTRRHQTLVSCGLLSGATVLRLTVDLHTYDLLLCVVYFAAGWLVASLRPRLTTSAASLLIAAGATLSVSVVSPALAALPFTFLVLAAAALVPCRWFSRNDVSYGTYLYGWPIQQLLVIGGVGALGVPVMIALSVPLSVLAGTASWFAVERRFLPRARGPQPRAEGADPVLIPV